MTKVFAEISVYKKYRHSYFFYLQKHKMSLLKCLSNNKKYAELFKNVGFMHEKPDKQQLISNIL